MKKLSLTLALLALTSVTNATTVTFIIEKDRLSFADGTAITRDADPDNRSSVNVFGVFTNNFSGFQTSLTTISTLISQGNTVDALSSLNGLFTGLTQGSVGFAGGLLINIQDWNGNVTAPAEGFTPIMVVTTASSLSGFTSTDEIGLVASNFTTFHAGTQPIGFNTPNHTWNVSGLGNLSSSTLQLAPIPEPSTYAAIFGLLALGAVVYRRRLKQ